MMAAIVFGVVTFDWKREREEGSIGYPIEATKNSTTRKPNSIVIVLASILLIVILSLDSVENGFVGFIQ